MEDLDSALQAAERTLAQRETDTSARLAQRQARVADGDQTDTGIPDDIVDLADLTERFFSLEGLANAGVQALATFATEAGEAFQGIDQETLSPEQSRVKLLGAAARLEGPSRALFEHGERLQIAVEEVDALLRSLIEQMRAIHLSQVQEQVDDLVSQFHDETGQLAEAVNMVDQMVEMLKFVSLMNVALRTALRPGIRGMQSIKSAVSALQGWERLSSAGGTA